MFDITDANNEFIFDDFGVGDGTPSPIGLHYVTATLTNGRYTGEDLAAEIERVLENSPGSSGQDYIVNFDTESGRFSIINAVGNHHDIDILWTNAGSTTAATLGFAVDDTITTGSFAGSDTTVGSVVSYDTVDFYGLSVKLAEDTGRPELGDVFSLYGVKDAARVIQMDAITAADPEKIAAAQTAFVLDGTNNTIVFDDDGNLNDGVNYRVVIPPGKYSPEELADEIERQLEGNGFGQSYVVGYDRSAHVFTIASNVTTLPPPQNDLILYWESDETTASFDLGFDTKLFSIESGNNVLQLNENGVPLQITITPGPYTGEEIAQFLEDEMRTVGSEDYTVQYNQSTRGFTITNPGTGNLTLKWSSDAVLSNELGFTAIDGVVGAAGSTTSDLTVHAIAGDSQIQSDFLTGETAVGDNRNALDIASLRSTNVMSGQTLTLDSFYQIAVGEVGTDVDETNRGILQQEFVLEKYEERRQSVSGVSLDEEMINLIKFQQAYAASAQLISTLDEMFNTLLNMR